MDFLFALLVLAAVGAGWVLIRRKKPGSGTPGFSGVQGDLASHLTPKPLSPDFQVMGWDGYSGMQLALGVELSEGVCFPLIEAGTQPPASRTQTFSTSRADQTRLVLAFYAGLSAEVRRSELVQRVSVGPIPITGEAIREVEVTCEVSESGAVTVQAKSGADGSALGCEVIESRLGAILVGR